MDRNRKQDQPRVRVMVDRRQIILGSVTLLCMAVLLIVGLTPRTAGDGAEIPDTAQVGSDSAATLSESCQLIQHLSYTPCGHALTRRQTLPPDLVGRTRADLEAAYDQWQVTSFSANEVTMEQAMDLFCPEHVILMPDDSGMLCVFQNRYGDALALLRELDLSLRELPDAYQEELRTGKGFDSQDELDQWLESIDS